jgi:hypothetical protein
MLPMARDVELTKCPIVKIENATLDTYLDVSGFGDFKIITFQRQLIWIRSATASVVLMRKGKLLRTVGNFNDHFGFLKSAETALEEAKKLAAMEEIGPESEIQVMVNLNIVDEPAIFDTSGIALDYMKSYPTKIAYRSISDNIDMRQFAYSGTDAMAKWVKGDDESKFSLHTQVPWIEPVMVISNQCLWDSSKPQANPTLGCECATAIAWHRERAVNFSDQLINQRDELLEMIRKRRLQLAIA